MKFKRFIVIGAAVVVLTAIVGTGPLLAAGKASNTESRQEPLVQQLTVDWNAARQYPRLELTRLSEQQLGAAKASTVPVLLPDRDGLLRSALIATGPGWYAASMAEDRATIVISGNSRVIRIPDIPEPPALEDPALKPSAGEGGLEVNFKAFGIYYDISVECYDGVKDPHCADGRYLMQVVDSLKLVLLEK